MKKIVFVLFSLFLLSARCNKAGDDCHYTIAIHNKSNDKVIPAFLILGNDGCRLDGKTLHPNQIWEYRPFNFCIENSLSGNDLIRIYIVDPSNFNSQNSHYPCDSIEFKNTILKEHILTLDDLKKKNFKITYP